MGAAVQSRATLTFGTMGTNFGVLVRGIAHEGFSRPSISLVSKNSPTVATQYTVATNETADTHYLMEKGPGAVVDLGRLRCDIVVDPDVTPPLFQPPETITVRFARSSATVGTSASNHAQFVCRGFVTEYDGYGAAWEEEPLGSMTIELTPNGTSGIQFTAES